MLKTILAISGKPGLYKLISQGKNMLVVESLLNGKRTPAYNHEKIISLGDIAMFTDSEEVPLNEVFESMKQLENGAKASVSTKDDEKTLREYLAKVLPNFDRERVYTTDIKKLISWYNLLTEKGYTDFQSDNAEYSEEPQEEAKAE
ncbi:MAG: DUF5606 domain-containing protein [Bacteroidaceae bacterium]|nr:hypothetical protein [Bacteroidales bacterium]MBQ2979725.1 DUF5606 domain-containing protein [Bacteroidaceae bacterium]